MTRIAIVGTGLIGGSIGLGIRARRPEVHVAGYDRDPGALDAALERGAVTEVAPNAGDAAAGADLVVVAVPMPELEDVCAELTTVVTDDVVVTDVGSAKQAVVAVAERALGGRFVGGHPMAGSERRGVGSADPDLFEGAAWILTPTSVTRHGAYATAAELASQLGATPVAVDPATHDSLVARLSHLPQLVAGAVVDVASSAGDQDALLRLAGGGFRDVTRIAASDPELWVGIMRSNRTAVLDALGRLEGALGHARALIDGGHWDDLRAWLDGVRAARLAVFAKPDYHGAPVAVSMLVPDRPGVLAEVTTAAGSLGANIEDLRIAHSTEGGRGRLELVVAGTAAADALAAALTELGYHVTVGSIDQ